MLGPKGRCHSGSGCSPESTCEPWTSLARCDPRRSASPNYRNNPFPSARFDTAVAKVIRGLGSGSLLARALALHSSLAHSILYKDEGACPGSKNLEADSAHSLILAYEVYTSSYKPVWNSAV